MIIGVPKEIKPDESRVAIQPSGVLEMKQNGHEVLVQKGAGIGSGFEDQLYKEAGATIIEDTKDLWNRAEMIMKVKEPIAEEYSHMREGQIVFTFFHFASSERLTKAVINSKCIAIAYETVEQDNGALPLLIPMSEVAGRMAAQKGAAFLQKTNGGRGVLMGGVAGVATAKFLVRGCGNVDVSGGEHAGGLDVYAVRNTVQRLS